jgi:hypothetical protein
MTAPVKPTTLRQRAYRKRKAAAELAEVRGIFAPVTDHAAIKALCKLDRGLLARMVERGWSDGDMAEYLTANDIVAGERILKALGVSPLVALAKTATRRPRPSQPPAAPAPASSE